MNWVRLEIYPFPILGIMKPIGKSDIQHKPTTYPTHLRLFRPPKPNALQPALRADVT